MACAPDIRVAAVLDYCFDGLMRKGAEGAQEGGDEAARAMG